MKGQTQNYYPPPVQAQPLPVQPRRIRRGRGPGCGCCACSPFLLAPFLLILAVLLPFYFLLPVRTDLLVLGIDRAPDGSAVARTDTMVLMSISPLKPVVKMLSIPRDLWVNIPGVGENRINTAHFFAEANQPGSGPAATLNVVESNFGVPVWLYVRLRFDAVVRIVDAMGGVTVDLPAQMGGLPAGKHHLDGKQALAFIRDRKGTDDFFRMKDGQLMIKAVALQALSPLTWLRAPLIANAVFSSVDTNLPPWLWPRIGLAFVRAAASGAIDNRTIQREMTTPTITSGGANVLMPNWDLIHPYVRDMFAQ